VFGGVRSHNLASDTGIIVQESVGAKSFDVMGDQKEDCSSSNSNSRLDNICSTYKSSWDQDMNENLSKSPKGRFNETVLDKRLRKPCAEEPVGTPVTGDEAVNKFGNAKAISSDMFFGVETHNDTGNEDSNLTRFQDSSSISSDMYFNREGTSGSKSPSYINMQAPDMTEMKQSVREGVSMVAGRLSSIASGVRTQIQDKYGY